jgi:hypothetical protein
MALRIATLLLLLVSLCRAQTLLPGVNPCAKQLTACDTDTVSCKSCLAQGSEPGGSGPDNLTCGAVLDDPLLTELGECIVSNALAVDGRICTPEDFAKGDAKATDAPTAAPTAVRAESSCIALKHTALT